MYYYSNSILLDARVLYTSFPKYYRKVPRCIDRRQFIMVARHISITFSLDEDGQEAWGNLDWLRMGQALRRTAGRFRGPNSQATSKSSPSPVQNQVAEAGRNAPSDSKIESPVAVKSDNWDLKVDPDTIPNDGALNWRDPKYDVMLHKMLGRVRVKQEGMLETGVVDHPESLPSVTPEYKRTIPKLQKTKVSTGHDEDKIVPPGKLNVSQLRQILLLYEGKAENQEKPMDAKGLAQRFQVDVLIIQKILQSVSLPGELNTEVEGKQN